MISSFLKQTLFLLFLSLGTLALTNYKLQSNFQSDLEVFLSTLPSEQISLPDFISYISPILRGSVERHDRELMSAIVRNYFDVQKESEQVQVISKSQILEKVQSTEFESYINSFAMKMYRHLVELYDITDDINEEQFAQMIEDPELYGLIWEDYLIMTENVEELLLETEYDKPDLEKTAKELNEMWETFKVEVEKNDKVEPTPPNPPKPNQQQHVDL